MNMPKKGYEILFLRHALENISTIWNFEFVAYNYNTENINAYVKIINSSKEVKITWRNVTLIVMLLDNLPTVMNDNKYLWSYMQVDCSSLLRCDAISLDE